MKRSMAIYALIVALMGLSSETSLLSISNPFSSISNPFSSISNPFSSSKPAAGPTNVTPITSTSTVAFAGPKTSFAQQVNTSGAATRVGTSTGIFSKPSFSLFAPNASVGNSWFSKSYTEKDLQAYEKTIGTNCFASMITILVGAYPYVKDGEAMGALSTILRSIDDANAQINRLTNSSPANRPIPLNAATQTASLSSLLQNTPRPAAPLSQTKVTSWKSTLKKAQSAFNGIVSATGLATVGVGATIDNAKTSVNGGTKKGLNRIEEMLKAFSATSDAKLKDLVARVQALQIKSVVIQGMFAAVDRFLVKATSVAQAGDIKITLDKIDALLQKQIADLSAVGSDKQVLDGAIKTAQALLKSSQSTIDAQNKKRAEIKDQAAAATVEQEFVQVQQLMQQLQIAITEVEHKRDAAKSANNLLTSAANSLKSIAQKIDALSIAINNEIKTRARKLDQDSAQKQRASLGSSLESLVQKLDPAISADAQIQQQINGLRAQLTAIDTAAQQLTNNSMFASDASDYTTKVQKLASDLASALSNGQPSTSKLTSLNKQARDLQAQFVTARTNSRINDAEKAKLDTSINTILNAIQTGNVNDLASLTGTQVPTSGSAAGGPGMNQSTPTNTAMVPYDPNAPQVAQYNAGQTNMGMNPYQTPMQTQMAMAAPAYSQSTMPMSTGNTQYGSPSSQYGINATTPLNTPTSPVVTQQLDAIEASEQNIEANVATARPEELAQAITVTNGQLQSLQSQINPSDATTVNRWQSANARLQRIQTAASTNGSGLGQNGNSALMPATPLAQTIASLEQQVNTFNISGYTAQTLPAAQQTMLQQIQAAATQANAQRDMVSISKLAVLQEKVNRFSVNGQTQGTPSVDAQLTLIGNALSPNSSVSDLQQALLAVNNLGNQYTDSQSQQSIASARTQIQAALQQQTANGQGVQVQDVTNTYGMPSAQQSQPAPAPRPQSSFRGF